MCEWDEMKINGQKVLYKKVKHDVNGNPRYIINYYDIDDNYDRALVKSRVIGGKKYNSKYIVITSYNLRSDLMEIIKC